MIGARPFAEGLGRLGAGGRRQAADGTISSTGGRLSGRRGMGGREAGFDAPTIREDESTMNTKQSKQDRKRAEALRRRLAELADTQQSSMSEMDQIQAELAELGVDDGGDDGSGERADPAAGLRDDLSELKASLDASEERYRRVLADFSNYQRRASENERRAREAGKAGVLEQMVAVLDTFDLAMRMDPASTTPEAMLQGVQMIKGEMLRLLSTQGFVPIDPSRGAEFDPHQHEAVTHAMDEDVAPGCVAEVMQTGYQLGDRVLRPAKVTVRPSAEAGIVGDDEMAGGGDLSGGAEQGQGADEGGIDVAGDRPAGEGDAP